MFVRCGQPIQYLNGYTFTLSVCSIYAVLLSLHIINVFQMWAFSLIQRTYNLNEKLRKKFFIYLDDNLRPQLKIEAPSGRAVLNYTQWYILVTFEDNIPKGKVHELGD